MMTNLKLRRTFEVEKLEGDIEKNAYRLVEKKSKVNGKERITTTMELTTIKVDAGYMVYFPAGHSIRVSEEALTRLGFNVDAHYIDMESGEIIPVNQEMSLKELSEMTTRSKNAKRRFRGSAPTNNVATAT